MMPREVDGGNMRDMYIIQVYGCTLLLGDCLCYLFQTVVLGRSRRQDAEAPSLGNLSRGLREYMTRVVKLDVYGIDFMTKGA